MVHFGFFETQMGWLVVDSWLLSGQPLEFWLRAAPNS